MLFESQTKLSFNGLRKKVNSNRVFTALPRIPFPLKRAQNKNTQVILPRIFFAFRTYIVCMVEDPKTFLCGLTEDFSGLDDT